MPEGLAGLKLTFRLANATPPTLEGILATPNGMKNLFVAVITNEKSTVADKLYLINNGQRITPLQTTYTGEPSSPQWKSMECSHKIIIPIVRH